MTTQEAITFLQERGYRVSAPRAQRAPRKLTGRKHRDCVDHHRVDGYTSAVCVMTAQDAGDVLGFARDCVRIGADAGDVLTAARMRDYGAQAVRVAA